MHFCSLRICVEAPGKIESNLTFQQSKKKEGKKKRKIDILFNVDQTALKNDRQASTLVHVGSKCAGGEQKCVPMFTCVCFAATIDWLQTKRNVKNKNQPKPSQRLLGRLRLR